MIDQNEVEQHNNSSHEEATNEQLKDQQPNKEAQKATVIYGRHPVLDAIEREQTIEKVLLQRGVAPELETEMRQLSKKHQFPLQYVPKQKLNKITSNNHQGIVAYVSAIEYHDAEVLLKKVLFTEAQPLVLILDGVTDVRNFGAIARSAECLGADAIIIQQKSSAPANGEAIKASAGALRKIKIGRINSLARLVAFLQNEGWQVLASDLQAEDTLMDMDFLTPTAVIIGSESKGVSKYLLKAADERFIIPQIGETDSFNVSVATGIILYEATRQKIASINVE